MSSAAIPQRFDIIVAGGGTAGSAAAIAAARRGHKVLLVEEGNCLGGTSTAGGVSEWYAGLEGMGDIFDRVRTEMQRFGMAFGRYYNGEYLKIVWQLLAEETGVTILFHSSLSGVRKQGRRVQAVSLLSCSQPLEVEADWFIDATGEGDLAALAGAAFAQGDPEHGRTLHMSLVFILADSGRPVSPYLPAGLAPINSEDELPGLHGGTRLPDGRVYCNMTKVMGHDPTDPLSLSEAEGEARRQIARIVHFLQRTGFPTHELVWSGAHIGIREGRRITGDYVLSEADITGEHPRRVFADGVAVATCQIDFHSLTKPGHVGWRQRVEPYNIPLRCLIARDFDNLLIAGKCISGDQIAHSSYRMTPTCCGMGQAAGTAAALAFESSASSVRDVEIGQLRSSLTEHGVELDPFKHAAFAPEVTPNRTLRE